MSIKGARFSNPQVEARYKGTVKIPRSGIRNVTLRATASFAFVEFETTHIPKIELEILDEQDR